MKTMSLSWIPGFVFPSSVNVSEPVPLSEPSPMMGLTKPAMGPKVPRKKFPDTVASLSGGAACCSSLPIDALASVPTKKPAFKSYRYKMGGWSVGPAMMGVRPFPATL